MSDIRFVSYVAFLEPGGTTYVTDEDGATEPGKRAMVFGKSEAREMVVRLMEKGIKSAAVVMLPKKLGRKLYNPPAVTAVSEDVIKRLKSMGCMVWVRGSNYRVYFSHQLVGTAGISGAATYLDCVTGVIHSDFVSAKERAAAVLEEVVAELAVM